MPPPRLIFSRGINILGEGENTEQVDIVKFFVFKFNILRVKVYSIEPRLFLKIHPVLKILTVHNKGLSFEILLYDIPSVAELVIMVEAPP
jgi:hypothetical protein